MPLLRKYIIRNSTYNFIEEKRGLYSITCRAFSLRDSLPHEDLAGLQARGTLIKMRFRRVVMPLWWTTDSHIRFDTSLFSWLTYIQLWTSGSYMISHLVTRSKILIPASSVWGSSGMWLRSHNSVRNWIDTKHTLKTFCKVKRSIINSSKN